MSKPSQWPGGPLRRSILCPTLLLATLSLPSYAVAQGTFIRGDVNFDEHVTVSDLSSLVDSFRPTGMALPCPDAGDANDMDTVDFTDLIFLTEFLVRQSPVLPPPFTTLGGDALEAGPDLTPDMIPCPPTSITPHGPPNPGFQMAWESPPTATVGEQVEVFLRAETAEPIDAFSVAYRVNNTVLSLQSVDFQGTIFPPGQRAAFEGSILFEARLVASPDPDFDLLIVTAVFADETFPHARIPFPPTAGPVAGVPLLRVVFDIRIDAPTGGPICTMDPAEPTDYPILAAGLFNEFTSMGMSRLPALTEPVKMTILLEPDEIVVFSRGDSNDDGAFDLSDASYTLNWLFVGGPAPGCMNAADSNDDGTIDLSDPTHTLGYLFSGSVTEIPLPGFPECDIDPADEDELDCNTYESCP
jgi:hypothetical protein